MSRAILNGDPMPKVVERCVKKVKKTIKPRNPKQTKESAAWGVCTASHKKKLAKRKH